MLPSANDIFVFDEYDMSGYARHDINLLRKFVIYRLSADVIVSEHRKNN